MKNLENFNQKHLAQLIEFTLEKNFKTFPLSLLKKSEILLEKKYYMGFEIFSQIYEILLEHYNIPTTKIIPQNNPTHQF
jgi:actin-related protein